MNNPKLLYLWTTWFTPSSLIILLYQIRSRTLLLFPELQINIYIRNDNIYSVRVTQKKKKKTNKMLFKEINSLTLVDHFLILFNMIC